MANVMPICLSVCRWCPCTAHSIDLVLKDIGKLDWAAAAFADCKEIVVWFRRNTWALKLLRDKAFKDKEMGTGLELINPGAVVTHACPVVPKE